MKTFKRDFIDESKLDYKILPFDIDDKDFVKAYKNKQNKINGVIESLHKDFENPEVEYIIEDGQRNYKLKDGSFPKPARNRVVMAELIKKFGVKVMYYLLGNNSGYVSNRNVYSFLFDNMNINFSQEKEMLIRKGIKDLESKTEEELKEVDLTKEMLETLYYEVMNLKHEESGYNRKMLMPASFAHAMELYGNAENYSEKLCYLDMLICYVKENPMTTRLNAILDLTGLRFNGEDIVATEKNKNRGFTKSQIKQIDLIAYKEGLTEKFVK